LLWSREGTDKKITFARDLHKIANIVEAQELGLEVWNGRPSVFKICPEAETDPPQEDALCAVAQCFTIDNVAYCKCE
jgi:hypothetical protein